MSLRCGVVGLPNVGKSTLFNCLSNTKAQSANFLFCAIEPNVGVITVPDERSNKLVEMEHPKRTVLATVEIVDIAGLIKGVSRGERLGNKFLSNIRETDAVMYLLRCFDDDNVTHVDGSVDPARDKEITDTELQLKDLETVQTQLKKSERQAQTGGDKQAKIRAAPLKRIEEALLQGFNARSAAPENKDEEQALRDLSLLTAKPVPYACNVDEASAATDNAYVEAVHKTIAHEDVEPLAVSAHIESEIAELEEYEERQLFLQELGPEGAGVNRLIRVACKLLNLETFFTTGADECCAWTFIKGSKTPQCAGIIHTDFERGFIRAEVIKYEDYVHYSSDTAVKEAGRMAVKGKDYVVQDGDVIYFRFNI